MCSIENQCANHYAMQPSVKAGRLCIIAFVEFTEFS